MKYLLWCANTHTNFKIAEFKSLATQLNITYTWIHFQPQEPYMIVEFTSEDDAFKLTRKSFLIRECYEIWGESNDEQTLHENVKNALPTFKHYVTAGMNFKLDFISFNKKQSQEEKLSKIMTLNYVPFVGKVNLNNPQLVIALIEYYGLCPNKIPDQPYKRFVGRRVCSGNRDILEKFSLKHRCFIGTTSMNAELAFIMANLAHVQPHSIVLDPFVGTGSILVSAAQAGARVWGWDIDYKTLHAHTKPSRCKQEKRESDESIRKNLEQYGLGDKFLDAVVMDASRRPWRNLGMVDAIITDPPYGMREARARIGVKNIERRAAVLEKAQQLAAEGIAAQPVVHFPEKTSYGLADIFLDLLNMAAALLRVGGKLVFWMPVHRGDYNESLIPRHPSLSLDFNCEQVLSVYASRRLFTYTKTTEPNDGDEASVLEMEQYDDFREKTCQASVELNQMTKQERKHMKRHMPMDKRGQGYPASKHQL